VDVEIKVNFTGSQIEQAKQVFDLKEDDAEKRDIWFGEIRTGRDGREALPLLDRGVILRVRAKKESGEVTVKLRGADGCIDVAAWNAVGLTGEKKLEGDWADRRQVSASLTVKSDDAGRIDFEAGVPQIVDLMSDDQKALAGRLMVPLGEVELLGPIAARKWKHEDIGGDIDAEEWTVGGLHFLEISISVPEQPEQAQEDLLKRVQAADLTVAPNQEPKTTQVLRHLAGDA
jgi:hypothetical protein